MGKRGSRGVASSAARDDTPTPIRSTVIWTVLGLVIEHPGYGYDLVARYQREYGEHLPITSDDQIYRGLDRLKEHGLVEVLPDPRPADAPQGGRQPKPHYRATDAGIDRYAAWLTAEMWAARNRAQAVSRQLGSLADAPTLALAVLDNYEARCLAEQRSAPLSRQEPLASGRAGLVVRLAAEERRLSLQALVPWCEYARQELKSLSRSASVGRGKT